MSAVENWTETEGIERAPGVCGGYPVITGTRTAVRHIIEDLQVNTGGVDALVQAHPHLSRNQVEAALVYYARYPQIIEEDIERNRVAWECLAGTDHGDDPSVSR